VRRAALPERGARFITPRGKVITDVFDSEFFEESVVLSPGDRAVLYTDGVIEARNEHNEFFGEARFIRTLLRLRHEKPDSLCDDLIRELDSFVGESSSFEDDITLVMLEYTG